MSHSPINSTPSKLAPALALLDTETHLLISRAGIAAGTVVARVLDMTVLSAHAAHTDDPLRDGRCQVSDAKGIDAQHAAVYLNAIPLGSSRILPPHVHPLTAAAVEELTGQVGLREISSFVEQGYAVWRRQALADALALLNEPRVWAKVCDVADALAAAGPDGLRQDEIEELVGDPRALTEHRPWTPDLTGLDFPRT